MIKARVLHMSNARQIDSANKSASTYKSTSKEKEKMEICLNCTKISCKRGWCEQMKDISPAIRKKHENKIRLFNADEIETATEGWSNKEVKKFVRLVQCR